MSYESLSDEKTKMICDKILPLFDTWTLKEVSDATDYLRALICSGAKIDIPSIPKDMSINDLTNPFQIY